MPADRESVTRWIDAYVAAWNSNEPGEIGALFADDAKYHTDPYGEPWSGRDAIVKEWLRRRDAPGETTFTWHPVLIAGDTAVIEGETAYPRAVYSNLWVLRFDDTGRCRDYTEWWMKQPRKRSAT
jgi:hypothetical protein